jgi:hypothetical protein
MHKCWKSYNNKYEVSNYGDMYSKKYRKLLKPHKTKKGYLRIDLGRKHKEYIHRLVAMLFIENIENKPTINHKNYNKTDNYQENLEWATYKEQKAHDIKNGKNHNKKDKSGKYTKS